MSNNKKTGLVIAGGLLVLLLFTGVAGYFIFSARTSGDPANEVLNQRRLNTLALIQEYKEAEEYDRALNLLEQLLLDSPQDQELRELQEELLNLRRLAREEELRVLEARNQELQRQIQESQRTQPQSTNDSQLAELEAQRALALARAAEAEAREREMELAQRQAELNRQRELEEERRRQAEAERQAAAEQQRLEEERLAQLSAEEAARQREIANFLQQAREKQQSGEFLAARQLIQRAIDIDSSLALPYARLAENFFLENPSNRINQDQARNAANEAITRDPQLWEPYFILGQIAAQNRDNPSALQQYTQAVQLSGQRPNARLLFELGNAQFLATQYSNARQSYEASLALDSSNERAYFNLGATFDQLGDRAKALDAYRRAGSVNPNYAAAFNRSGEILRSLGELDAAVVDLRKAVDLDPTIRHSRSFANALYDLSRFDEALPLYRRVVQQEPENPVNNYNYATVLLDVNKPEDALQFAAKAVQLDNSRAEYSYTLGLTAKMLGGYDQAEEFLKRAIDMNPQYLRAQIELGALYILQEKPELALQTLTGAKDLDPQSVEVNTNLGIVHRMLGQYQQSETYIRAAINQRQNDAALRYTLALTQISKEDLQGARQSLELAIRLDGTYWIAYHRLGEVHIATNNPTQAKSVLNQLISLNPDYNQKDEIQGMLASL